MNTGTFYRIQKALLFPKRENMAEGMRLDLNEHEAPYFQSNEFSANPTIWPYKLKPQFVHF